MELESLVVSEAVVASEAMVKNVVGTDAMVALAGLSAVVEGADSTAVTEALVENLRFSRNSGAVVAARVLSETSVEAKCSQHWWSRP